MTKRITAALCVLAAAVLGACGGSGGGLPEPEHDFTETDETIEYTFFSPNWQDFENTTDRILGSIEEKFNVKIHITGASGTNWMDRLSTEIADNDTPDLFFVQPETSTVTDYIRKQVITDLNPYIERADAKNLKAIFATEQYKTSTLIGGRNCFVPQSVGYTTRVILVRKDWMKQWNEAPASSGGRGLTGADVYAAPGTLSELTSMLRYFRNGDPDGDGKKNTYGMALSKNFDYVQDFFATFGLRPDWTKTEDGFVLSALTDGYTDMLTWFNTGHREGYLRPDFFASAESDALMKFYQGECGAVVTSGDLLLDGVINEIKNAFPGEDYRDLLTLIAPPDSDDGKFVGAFKGWNFYWGGWCISADAPEPMRLIRILDYLISPEGQKLMVYGIEGTHYTVENGTVVPDFAERLKEGALSFNYPDGDRTKPAGRYTIGYQFMPCPYTIEDNRLVINYPYDTSADPEMMKSAYDLTYETTPNFSALTGIISDIDLNDYNSQIIDAVEIYSMAVIADASKQAEALADLENKLSAYKYEQVCSYLNENF